MNIISFSVWGNEDKYLKGCFENIEIAKEIYPGWKTRFYCDSQLSSKFISDLNKKGAQTVIKETVKNNWEGLFWRFLPASEKDVDIFISRDIDSRLNEREKAAVDEWLASDKDIHCMRDHIEHNVPILGGMWGSRKRVLFNIESLINEWVDHSYKGSDQDFLREKIWNENKHRIICHDKFHSGLTVINGHNKIGFISKYDKDHPLPDEIAPDYVYDPISFFGNHDIRPFPKHLNMSYGTHVGEII